MNQRSSWQEVVYIMLIRKKQSEVELTWTRWSSIAEGYCQWDRGYQEFSLFSNAMFRCQDIISLFIACGAGKRIVGGGGGHMIFRRTKGEITENFGRITAWGTAQICLENEDIWWGDRESQQMLLGGDHFSEVTLKGRMFLVTHQF